MSDEYITRDFLRKHGEALIDQGYTVIPIQPGKKAPGFDGWQKAKGTKDQVRTWLQDGFKTAGVGILTKFTCAIDIDCMDEDAAQAFQDWCEREIGAAPVRIGKPPKRLLLYRTLEPFKKRRSTIYSDEWNEKNMIEVLGDGQQFVAYHIHPDTGKPYHWVGDASPLTVRATDLPEITAEQIDSLIEAFESYAKDHKWDVLKVGRNTSASSASNTDNPWVEDTNPIDISDDELRQRLMLVSGCDDYDTWFQVGMALYHQYDGDEAGLDLWNEWSETADNYDADALQRHWASFDIKDKKRAPLTARYILRLAKESIERTALELGNKIRDAFVESKTITDWEAARKLAQEAEIDGLSRATLAAVAKEKRDQITGVKTPLGEIKKAIAFKAKTNDETPGWATDWVYDTSDDKFFNTSKKIAVSQQGFCAMYDRKAFSKKDLLDGNTSPSSTASDLALNVFNLPTVDGRRYMPGRDAIFHEPDGTFCNTYPEHEIPDVPEKMLPRDVKVIERVKAHIDHLLKEDAERRMLLDWISWVVQNPGKHVNYAVLLQGVEGDGKSFFAELMRAVMGVSNVTMLNAHIVHSDFTDWAYGQCVACLEEVRIVGRQGKDKWETVNRIKPFITNNVIEIHPKGKAVMNVINTTSYMLFSNYKDALPLDENSRRYLVLFSRWQHREELKAFKEANPKYYERLYDTLSECAGALRKWLIEHEQDESFDPRGDAPETKARKVMIAKSKPEFIQVLDQIIEDDETVEASRDMIDLTTLPEVMAAAGVDWPSPKALISMLERDGYELLARMRIEGGEKRLLYSRSPDQYSYHGADGKPYADNEKIRKFFRERMKRLGKTDGFTDTDDQEVL